MDAAPVALAPAPEPVHVVALGASAGGLSALEQFFWRVQPRSGLAYVVVLHLDPTQKAMLAELLQRVTSMPVRQIADMMRIQADCVYVIPPNAELTVEGDALKLTPPAEAHGLRLPINVLFSSLARARGDRAIAVILSGMGSDGTQGMQAIKALGGLTVVQQPASAQFDGMPRSAIDAGCGDIVVAPAEMPDRIVAYLANRAAAKSESQPESQSELQPELQPDARPHNPLSDIFALLRSHTRQDFSLYKPNGVRRRIERRMAIHGIATAARYAEFMRSNAPEIDLLFRELLIGVTSFFRDPALWRHLSAVVLPELLARQTRSHNLRAWMVGCSTGEEAYSLAMIFAEVVERLPQHQDRRLQIFASDLSPDAIASARRGVFSSAIAADVSPDRLARFFTLQDGAYRINKEIRSPVLFAVHDVLLDAPFTRLDLLSCRNLMIYFDVALQARLLPLFHYSLRPGGVLVLGTAESVGKHDRLFAPLDAKRRLYLRQDSIPSAPIDALSVSFPPLSTMTREAAVPDPGNPAQDAETLQKAADYVLLQVHAPPAVVVNPVGDIVYVSGRTGNYLEPAAGKANWNFHAMVRESLRPAVTAALARAVSQSEPVLLRALEVKGPGGTQLVDVTVQALNEPAALRGMLMVVFRRREPARASNEEQRSTNEELTTLKEEMQSMNDELQVINAEMRTKLDDLARAQSDMKNLLNGVDIAILYLDRELNVRRYTELAANIFSLREGDIGRPVSDLATRLKYPTLKDDVTETLRTLEFTGKEVVADDGRWFSVRIIAYRRLDNVIDGAMITLVDISAAKALETRLRQAPKR